MEPQYCANPDCVKHTEHRGGRFLYSVTEGKTFCEDCFHMAIVANPGRNLWDYYTSHPTGKREYVGSLANMRKIEKASGTSNFAANYETKNWS